MANIGQLGDVKLSVLEPAAFQNIHGKEWVLMAGQAITTDQTVTDSEGAILVNSALFGPSTKDRTNLPDARGVFLRGLNLQRPGDGGDPFEQETGRPRQVGEPQDDQFREHNHVLKYRTSVLGGANTPTVGSPGDAHCVHSTHTLSTGGRETRPKNVSVYIYLKVR
ncbi:MAG: hypothetical protein KC800_22305 [Candidatus Eremiobacteraeota bacterium]|nr:hypothetical protein [Candidatus Eremiobacteraeota bacterium]